MVPAIPSSSAARPPDHCCSICSMPSAMAGAGPPRIISSRDCSICAKSRYAARDGKLPNPLTPHTVDTWFIPGVSPIEVSQLHRAVPINPETGLRACREQPGQTAMKVYEFWPSDLLTIFRQAGVSLAGPPPFEPGCVLDEVAQSGMLPRITSPVAGVAYQLRSDRLNEETLVLTANVDGDVRTLYWFVDDGYIGKCAADQPLVWTPHSGTLTIRVVDDHGRAAQKEIEVGVVRDPR